MGNNFVSSVSSFGFPYSAPVSYTPGTVSAPGSTTFNNAFWYRRGHVLVSYGQVVFGSNDGAASRFELILLPSPLTMNTSYVGADLTNVLGVISYFRSGGGTYGGTCLIRSDGKMAFQPGFTLNAFLGNAITSGDQLDWFCEIPVTGWG